LSLKPPAEPNFASLGEAVSSDLGGGESQFAKWDTMEFQRNLPADLTKDKKECEERAKKHFRRGTRCYQERALDPSNAFSAILEFRRAMAYNYACGDAAGPLAADLDEIRQRITACQRYIKDEDTTYSDGWNKSMGIVDYDEAARYCQRAMALFSGRYYGERAQEYHKYEVWLNELYRRHLIHGQVFTSGG
jgi:hypothetical protein